jgi:hypothetical protein
MVGVHEEGEKHNRNGAALGMFVWVPVEEDGVNKRDVTVPSVFNEEGKDVSVSVGLQHQRSQH